MEKYPNKNCTAIRINDFKAELYVEYESRCLPRVDNDLSWGMAGKEATMSHDNQTNLGDYLKPSSEYCILSVV